MPQRPENPANGRRILPTWRLKSLARPVAATKVEDTAGRALSAISGQLLDLHREQCLISVILHH